MVFFSIGGRYFQTKGVRISSPGFLLKLVALPLHSSRLTVGPTSNTAPSFKHSVSFLREMVTHKTTLHFRAIKKFPVKETGQGGHHFSRTKTGTVRWGSHRGVGGKVEEWPSSGDCLYRGNHCHTQGQGQGTLARNALPPCPNSSGQIKQAPPLPWEALRLS